MPLTVTAPGSSTFSDFSNAHTHPVDLHIHCIVLRANYRRERPAGAHYRRAYSGNGR